MLIIMLFWGKHEMKVRLTLKQLSCPLQKKKKKKKGDVRCGRIFAIDVTKYAASLRSFKAESDGRHHSILPWSTNDPPTSRWTSIIPEVNPKKIQPGKNLLLI